MKTPKNIEVSIIMSTYNDRRFIEESITSVSKQSFTKWELIIIDDASNDDTQEIVNRIKKKERRIRYYRNQNRLGLTKNLNYGIDLAKADLIARIDSDDVWISKYKLQKQISFIKNHPNTGLIGTWVKAIDESGKNLYDLRYPYSDKEIRKSILLENLFVHSSVLFNKNLVVQLGKYPQEIYAEDYDLWLKVGSVSKFHILTEFLTGLRIRAASKTQTQYKEIVTEILKQVEKHKKVYPNFHKARLIWTIRSFYPLWFRTRYTEKIKSAIRKFWP